jgi:multicomponent Na+:H+ antiporter subunit D
MTFASVGLTAFRNKEGQSLEAAFKYLVIGSLGSSLVLLGTTIIYAYLHTLNLAQITSQFALFAKTGQHPIILWFAVAIMIGGYAVKAFLVPCHIVAPDAYMAAPASVSMLFSGVVNKAGVYGILRLMFVAFQSMGLPKMQMLMVFWGTITMFVGVTMALYQNDFKRLLAFHSISQVGYIITGAGLYTVLGLTGGLYHALNHSIFKGLLFLCAGAVFYAAGTTDLNKLGGLSKKMPVTTILFLVGAFSISGLPPFNGFASKWIIYQATYEKAVETNNPAYAVEL